MPGSLLSFSGRLNRKPYWLISLAVIVYFTALIVAGAVLDLVATWGLILVLMASGLLVSLAASVRRLHDRDKPGWWILLFYAVPAILDQLGQGREGAGYVFSLLSFGISIWALVELGFLKGSAGSNRYGPDRLTTPQ